MHASTPAQVSLVGHRGVRSKLMGPFKRTDKTVHGYPAFTKTEDGVTHYLFRSSDDGRWAVTDDEKHIAKNFGWIVSKDAAELPTQEGLEWQYWNNGSFKDDSAITCTEVGQILAGA